MCPQPVVRVVHELPDSNLVLPTEPLSQPLRRVRVNCRVGRADLSEAEVVRPSGYHPVQAIHSVLRFHQLIPAGRLLTDSAADALNARLARAGAYETVKELDFEVGVSVVLIIISLSESGRSPTKAG